MFTDLLCGERLKDMKTVNRFRPPLDLPAPEGKEAEWALLRMAEIYGVERNKRTWQELADAIIEAMKSTEST